MLSTVLGFSNDLMSRWENNSELEMSLRLKCLVNKTHMSRFSKIRMDIVLYVSVTELRNII